MTVPSGPSSLEPFAHYDPDSLCWRMSQQFLPLENLIESQPTWPKRGTCSRGLAYELPTWAPRINVNASSLLPTPTAMTPHDDWTVEQFDAWKVKVHSEGRGSTGLRGDSLEIAAKRIAEL